MKLIVLSISISAFVGGLVGFSCIAIIDYIENKRGEPSVVPPTLSEHEALVSVAEASWAQRYWLKRIALAIEIENTIHLEDGDEEAPEKDEFINTEINCRDSELPAATRYGLVQ